ncbi:transcriptional regulator, LysR family [Pseudooceanicola antarcticus]|uniref:LysR family transcriptional regulator n=1 Tax=Pseudooceanicola antarcticus TaxID=1247613 RepID=A0A285J653_9RHOB|nr:LysR family transcriptional regulator [Pseudooceanicola antarcticus]PJE26927.1 LysR family transcriptional regulator [Pseudooceanicola antarcticus]SNY55795.1 transcriptional regulator, LysR family [Pseudooceanicola antarcticus]
MNWDDLRVFLSVGRLESLSAAARALRIDPATVGRRIARLEEETGTALFAKSPQGYALTEAGQRLMAHAAKGEAAFLAGAAEVAGQGGPGLSGQVRIGAPDGVANFLLPQVCASILDENPELELQIVALPRLFNLSRREADMVVTVSAPTAGRLLVQKISDYHLHLAATEGYLAQHPPIRALEDLGGHRMVGYIPDMIFDKELDYLEETGVSRVQLGSNSVSVQFHWVAGGAGLGILHDFSLPHHPGLRRVLPETIRLKRSFYLVRHEDDARLDRLNRLAALLSERLRAEITRQEGLS